MDIFCLQDFSTEPPKSSRLYDDDDNNGISGGATFSVASNTPKKRAGRKKFQETRHPVFRGVRRKKSGKWVCEIREPNKKTRIWLGTYATAEMAARAHDVAAIALRGQSACLNFADSAWKLPVPTSTDAESIQKAAAEAGKLFAGESDDVEVVAPEDMREKETTVGSPENEEEDLFGMPGLINDMAEGLMLPPPHCMEMETEDYDVDSYADVSLWSYSV